MTQADQSGSEPVADIQQPGGCVGQAPHHAIAERGSPRAIASIKVLRHPEPVPPGFAGVAVDLQIDQSLDQACRCWLKSGEQGLQRAANIGAVVGADLPRYHVDRIAVVGGRHLAATQCVPYRQQVWRGSSRLAWAIRSPSSITVMVRNL